MKMELCQIPPGSPVRKAMEALEAAATEIVLVVDDTRKVLGTVTDGDIRRTLLRGATLEHPVEICMQRAFKSAPESAGRAEILDLMKAWSVSQIPLLDEEGRLVGLHLLHEIVGGHQRPNWAVIMAGGKGTRLRPITEHLPKPMIQIAGRPILERLVLHVLSFGVRRIFLSINYLGEMVQRHFGDGSQFGCEIEYLTEDKPLGTGGALSLLPALPEHPVLVMNGDVVTQADLGAMLDFHQRHHFDATMAIREYTHTVPFGCVETKDNRVVELVEKPTLRQQVNTGIYVLSPSLLSNVPARTEFPITQLFENCFDAGIPVGAYLLQEDWIDVGHHDQLRQARGSH